MRSQALLFSSLLCAAFCTVDASQTEEKLEKAKDLLVHIRMRQTELEEQLEKLETLLGVENKGLQLEPLSPKNVKNITTKITRQGIDFFAKKEYEKAKELFHKAWEEEPTQAITNYNLGLSYAKLGKDPLAKKFLKSAIEIDIKLSESDQIKKYMNQEVVKKKKEKEDPALAVSRTKVINLRKKVDSYLSSRSLSLSDRMQQATVALRQMESFAKEYDQLIEEYYLDISDRYVTFEMYDEALRVIKDYQTVMKDKVLPDGFHKDLLLVKEKQKDQQKAAEKLFSSVQNRNMPLTVQKDLRELGIFSEQVDQFVTHLERGDEDFDMVCQRLKDYRWGNKTGRHVVITDRFQRLLFSSLEGTLSLDQYQDIEGNKFFKTICQSAHRQQELSSVEPNWARTTLKIGGKKVPYLLLWSYIPQHESFLIVRIPERDVL